MNADQLKENRWYWLRLDDGSLAPYRLHRVTRDKRTGALAADVFVGSFLRTWPVSRIVAEAQMPTKTDVPKH